MSAGGPSRFLALVLLLAAAFWGCASSGPRVDTHGWLEVRTPGFRLYGNLEEAQLRELAEHLLLFDAVVRKVTNTRIDHSRLPVHLFVMADAEQARQFMPDSASGVIYPTLEGYFSIMEGDDVAFWTRHVLLHEYAHYVLRGDRRTPLPRWYDEGLCEFLAYMTAREDVIVVGRSATSRLAQLNDWGRMPLDDLFGLESGDRVNAARFYATSWALVHHLNTTPTLTPQANAYVARLARGESWQEAFDAAFEPSLEELEASLARHVAFLQRGGRLDFHLPASKVSVPDDFAVTPMPEAEISYQLGELTRRIAAWEPREARRAQRLFERALARDPGHERARSGLAWSLATQGRFEPAARELAKLDDAARRDPVVAFDAAQVAVMRAETSGDLAEVGARSGAEWELIERAVALAPDAPAPHALRARWLAASDERDAAIASFERARELGGWSPRLDVELARLYLDAGQRDRATALLRPVASDVHQYETAEEARRLLEELEKDGSPEAR